MRREQEKNGITCPNMTSTVLSTGATQRLSEMEAGQTIQAEAFMHQSFCNDWRGKLISSIGTSAPFVAGSFTAAKPTVSVAYDGQSR
jgi:hypothetical protein